MKTYNYILSVAAAATLACVSYAQTVELSHADRSFFEKAAKAGQKEVAISQTCQPNLTTASTRELAGMIASDHGKANEELRALAAKKGVVLPVENAKLAQKWSKNDKDADEDYLEEMVSEHKDAIELFEKAAKSKDAEIAAFAEKTLPTLRQHLARAQAEKKAH